jgi:hypothetical protein
MPAANIAIDSAVRRLRRESATTAIGQPPRRAIVMK